MKPSKQLDRLIQQYDKADTKAELRDVAENSLALATDLVDRLLRVRKASDIEP